MKRTKSIQQNFSSENEDPESLIREIIKSEKFPKFFSYQQHLSIFLK
jgi:hypothetical protein